MFVAVAFSGCATSQDNEGIRHDFKTLQGINDTEFVVQAEGAIIQDYQSYLTGTPMIIAAYLREVQT